MNYTYPHTIDNGLGEKIIFSSHQKDQDIIYVENFVKPGCGPVMHTHYKQDESLTVIKGKMGYQILDKEEKFVHTGETALFMRGVPHRFWNAGDEILNCTGWIKPANSIVFYLSSLYAAQLKSGTSRPEQFDAAYLMHRYKKEYALPGIPAFVKNIIIPLTYFIGNIVGKYKKFKDAPAPL